MDWSAIIATIALIISIIFAIRTERQNTKSSNRALESEYFLAIYKDVLIKRLPRARSAIMFDKKGELQGIDEMLKELQRIEQDSLYFKYNNEPFFLKLTKKTSELEDYLIKLGNDVCIGEKQTDALIRIKGLIQEIYATISKEYKGR